MPVFRRGYKKTVYRKNEPRWWGATKPQKNPESEIVRREEYQAVPSFEMSNDQRSSNRWLNRAEAPASAAGNMNDARNLQTILPPTSR